MKVKINFLKKDVFGVTLDEELPVLVPLNQIVNGIEMFDFHGAVGVCVYTNEGVFTSDIQGPGTYYLTHVEDNLGNLIEELRI